MVKFIPRAQASNLERLDEVHALLSLSSIACRVVGISAYVVNRIRRKPEPKLVIVLLRAAIAIDLVKFVYANIPEDKLEAAKAKARSVANNARQFKGQVAVRLPWS